VAGSELRRQAGIFEQAVGQHENGVHVVSTCIARPSTPIADVIVAIIVAKVDTSVLFERVVANLNVGTAS
jgi:hypothetical protein